MKSTFVSKNELAQAYFPYIEPHAACNKLMKLIGKDKVLMKELVKSGYTKLARSFSPVQVKMIFERMGNPFK